MRHILVLAVAALALAAPAQAAPPKLCYLEPQYLSAEGDPIGAWGWVNCRPGLEMFNPAAWNLPDWMTSPDDVVYADGASPMW